MARRLLEGSNSCGEPRRRQEHRDDSSRAPALGPPFARADNPLVGYYRRPESSELRRCIISGTSIESPPGSTTCSSATGSGASLCSSPSKPSTRVTSGAFTARKATRRIISSTGEASCHSQTNLRSCFDVRIVSLHSDGEPLLNKRLEAYIEHLTMLGIYVTVSSNCSLLSDERSHRLIKAGLRMVGTDFCADPALYERLRVRGVWRETLDGIRQLLRASVDLAADFRVVIKDMATHGVPPKDAKLLMERTRGLQTGRSA